MHGITHDGQGGDDDQDGKDEGADRVGDPVLGRVVVAPDEDASDEHSDALDKVADDVDERCTTPEHKQGKS